MISVLNFLKFFFSSSRICRASTWQSAI